MTIVEQLQPGPCVICAATNYPLSAGGPTICPSCDCGDFGLVKVQRQAAEIERLRIDADALATGWNIASEKVARLKALLNDCLEHADFDDSDTLDRVRRALEGK